MTNRLNLDHYRANPRPSVFLQREPKLAAPVRLPYWLSLTLLAVFGALSGAGLVLLAQLTA